MKTGIIQPGRLGDLIILLPAAKYLSTLGHQVYWPIFEKYVWMFEEVVDYVKFIPIYDNTYTAVKQSYNELNKISGIRIIDVAATFPESTSTDEYVKCGDGLIEKFDAFKYRKLNVPLNEKWNLTINRNYKREDELYNILVTNEKYALINLKHSKGSANPILESSDGQIIHTTEDYNIFHWIKLIEKATTIVMVDSSMANLVEQLNIKTKKFLISKGDNRLPTLRNNWIIK